MEKQELQTIIGTYNPINPIPRLGPMLELKGPFNREAIDEVIQKNIKGIPSPYGFSTEDRKVKGGAIFLVDNERAASELVDVLNEALLKYKFVIRYEGYRDKPLA